MTDHIYVGVNYVAVTYDPEYNKYACCGGTAYGSCIDECMLSAIQYETELCKEFGMKLMQVRLKSVITDLYDDRSKYIPYD